MKVCEFGEFQATGRCRRHARVVVGYRQPFGLQIGPKGETPTYTTRATYRCIAHATTGLKDIIGTLMVQEYEARLAQPAQ